MALRTPFDQFAKHVLRDALSLISTAETEVEVTGAPQKIDVFCIPDPARAAERARMGLLGELAAEPAMFEPFHATPGLGEIRRLVGKQHTWHHELERRARTSSGGARPVDDAETAPGPAKIPFPALVVLTPGRPVMALDAYHCEPVAPGVYRSAWGLALRVIVLAELPRTRETLVLRLLASGRVLTEALAELSALPADAWEHRMAMPLVIHFRLWIKEPTAPQEDTVSAEIRAWFEEYEKKKRAETLAEGRACALLTVLRVRGIAVTDAARERILAQRDPDRLERWLERAVVAASITEVLDDPS